MSWWDNLFGSKYKEGQKGVDKTGKPLIYRNGKWYLDTSRKQNNTSKTAERSQYMENEMHKSVMGRQNLRIKKGVSTSWKYAIPYIKDKEIKISGTKSFNGLRVPTNALDSLAKYAQATKTPIEIALGLAFQETTKGNHIYYNFQKIKKDMSEKEKQKRRSFNKALGNAEYFKNFGIIPAENFVNDHEYTDGGYNNGQPITDRPPLQHAFEHFNAGRYNPAKKAEHTAAVKTAGADIWKSPEIQNWWKSSEYYYE